MKKKESELSSYLEEINSQRNNISQRIEAVTKALYYIVSIKNEIERFDATFQVKREEAKLMKSIVKNGDSRIKFSETYYSILHVENFEMRLKLWNTVILEMVE